MRNLFHAVYYWVNVMTWVRLLVLLAVKRDVQGLQHIPRKGALILASNHLNVGDPSVLTGVTPRRIIWLTKQELFDIPVFGILYHLFGCIPVRRFQADLRALRRSQEALLRGLDGEELAHLGADCSFTLLGEPGERYLMFLSQQGEGVYTPGGCSSIAMAWTATSQDYQTFFQSVARVTAGGTDVDQRDGAPWLAIIIGSSLAAGALAATAFLLRRRLTRG